MIYVIIPVKNEATTIEQTIDKVYGFLDRECGDQYRVVFIDDGSTDNSFEIIRRKTSGGKAWIFKNRFDRGKGSAIKTAYVLLNMRDIKDSDFIAFLDGDGQIHPKQIKTLMNIMFLYDADAVVGNKRHPYSAMRYCLTRRIVSLGYNLVIRILFGLNLRDTQCGIKIFKRGALDSVIDKVCSKRYAFDLELLVALKENMHRVVDAPVFIDRQFNSGSVNLKNVINTAFDTAGIFFNKMKGYYRC